MTEFIGEKHLGSLGLEASVGHVGRGITKGDPRIITFGSLLKQKQLHELWVLSTGEREGMQEDSLY